MSKVLARCADYNGNKNVLFMMSADDFRLADAKWGYSIVGPAKYSRKDQTLVSGGKTYRVFSDWSVKETQGA